MATPQNTALWMAKRGARLQVDPAPHTHAQADEIVVRARAVAVNPVDGIPGLAYRLILPRLKFPAVIGGDLAGEVVEVGTNVKRFKIGDRVTGLALGLEQSRNRAAEGAFQHYVVLLQHMVTPIPDGLSFEQACVLPLTLSTAATGMFQKDHLGLAMPTANPADRNETVLVWGGSTSVGCNAIQLACCAGYRVVATSSPRNFELLRSLGALVLSTTIAPMPSMKLWTSLETAPSPEPSPSPEDPWCRQWPLHREQSEAERFRRLFQPYWCAPNCSVGANGELK